MPEQLKKSRLSFSLRMMIIVTVVMAIISFAIAYQYYPSDYEIRGRHSAPIYALEMLENTDVTWDLDERSIGTGGKCDIRYPSHPDHRYVIIMSIKTKQQKFIRSIYTPRKHNTSLTEVDPNYIGYSIFDTLNTYLAEKQIDLTGATIWAEIIVEDEFDKVIFHGVKESIPYEEALAEQKRKEAEAGQPSL